MKLWRAARAACSLEDAITSPGSSGGPPSEDGDTHCRWLQPQPLLSTCTVASAHDD